MDSYDLHAEFMALADTVDRIRRTLEEVSANLQTLQRELDQHAGRAYWEQEAKAAGDPLDAHEEAR